ncbi:MAG: hypothetical protein QOD85_407 [Gaiellaceae bacterium]|jgi:hypothetical protein|nr:hypothetical protein [Gaiellaceae bacterium]
MPIHRLVEKIVTVVICGLLLLPTAGAAASPGADALLRDAARLSGLRVHRAVPRTTLAGSRYDRLLAQARSRDYPPALRSLDARLYTQLGLTAPSLRTTTAAVSANSSKAWYDPSARKLVLRRGPAAKRSGVINELVRALVDQNFNLRRVTGLRARDRDGAFAAKGIVNGTAALASGVRPAVVRGAALERFEELEDAGALSAGKTLASQLRYLGGAPALASALRSFPSTTEQLLHIDKFLEREPALPVGLPAAIGDDKLSAAESFGELDVRSLLRAFGVPNAADVAGGWGGGRLGLYTSPVGQAITVLALRWDTIQDADEWREASARYVTAAFPGATPRNCPPLDRCWATGSTMVGAGVFGTTGVLASGPGADVVAAAVLAAN